MRTFSVVLAAVVAATAMAGKFHDSSRPCFRKSEARDEVITGPRMHEALDMSAVPTSLDWRVQLQSMGGSISAARQQVSPLLKSRSTSPSEFAARPDVPPAALRPAAASYCGACWAFAATSAMSDRLRISARGAYPEIDIAPQVVLDCDNYDDGCYGGDPTTAYKFIHENNVTSETCNLYMAQGHYKTGRTCTSSSYCYTCSPSTGCAPVAKYDAHHIDQYGSISGETQMIAELQRGPITCGVAVTAGFEDYRGGIFTDPTNSTNIEHSISVVGYGEEKGQKYWIGRNSWGTWWGEARGFFRIARGSANGKGNLCIECDCQFGVPTGFKPPSPLPLKEGVIAPELTECSLRELHPISPGRARAPTCLSVPLRFCPACDLAIKLRAGAPLARPLVAPHAMIDQAKTRQTRGRSSGIGRQCDCTENSALVVARCAFGRRPNERTNEQVRKRAGGTNALRAQRGAVVADGSSVGFVRRAALLDFRPARASAANPEPPGRSGAVDTPCVPRQRLGVEVLGPEVRQWHNEQKSERECLC
ncbi:CTSZ [Symbiodinium sp. KB8]|nr:CTSZ [Symbiodinium sp. KB8]